MLVPAHVPLPVPAPGCWKCEGGLIPMTRDEAANGQDALVIVHNG